MSIRNFRISNLFNIKEDIKSFNPEYLWKSLSTPFYTFKTFEFEQKFDNSNKEEDKEYYIGDYLIQKALGEGTFAKVKLGIFLPEGKKVGIKIIAKNKIIKNSAKIFVNREFDILSKLNHPNVIYVEEIFETNYNYYSIMEYCEGGDLYNYLVKNRRLSDEEAAFFYFQLINGLEYIHSLGVAHRDLKPENLLLTK